jgi:hypothetical protein
VQAEAVYQAADNPNDITVTHEFPTLSAARTFANSDELKKAMHGAGVVEAPMIWFAKKVDRQRQSRFAFGEGRLTSQLGLIDRRRRDAGPPSAGAAFALALRACFAGGLTDSALSSTAARSASNSRFAACQNSSFRPSGRPARSQSS